MSSVYETGLDSPVGSCRPLLAHRAPDCPIAWRDGRPVSAAAFLAAVAALAARLPTAPAAVNLCEDRYAFLVAFAALLTRGQVNLLPPSRAPRAIAQALAAWPGSYALGDVALTPAPAQYVRFTPDSGGASAVRPLLVADAALAAVGYTSGSTGVPGAHPRWWSEFALSSAHNDSLLRGLAGRDYHVVATVPPQHMYGLEFSILLPLLARATVHSDRPFFPADIARALGEVPAPRVLVITPVHLRALVEARAALPRLAAIVCATAPLARDLACAAERRLDAPVQEVFGSTETCVIAHRRTTQDAAWTPYPGVMLRPQPGGTRIEAPQLRQPATLADIVELTANGGFRLCGRNTDYLAIAGKRASLGDLTRKLLEVPGVRDGVVFQLDDAGPMGVHRIAALVVAPGCSATAIMRALRDALDPVFLPRPLVCVRALPRSRTGKLPRAALLTLLKDRHAEPGEDELR